MRMRAPNGGAQYDVRYGAAPAVSPPPASQIETGTEVPEKKPSGPFVTVKAGTTNGVTWALQRSPGTNGTECWRWQATPPLQQLGVNHPGDPQCSPPTPATSDDASDLVGFVVVGNAAGPYDALAVELPAGVTEDEVVQAALRRAVRVSGLAHYRVDAPRVGEANVPAALVLGFGNVIEERILRGIEVLGEVLSGTPI